MNTNAQMPDKGLFVISKYNRKTSRGYIVVINLETRAPIFNSWTPNPKKSSNDILQMAGAFEAILWILSQDQEYTHPVYITSETTMEWLKKGICKKINNTGFTQFFEFFYNSTRAFDLQRVLVWDPNWKLPYNDRVEYLIKSFY